MGNLYSAVLNVELYKWSSAEFPREYALTYTSFVDKSIFSISRLSVNRERVLLRLADSLCHDHPARLHMELTAERDHSGIFNFGKVTVLVDGIPAEYISYRDDGVSTYFGGRYCNDGGARSTEIFGSVNKMSWEFSHLYKHSVTLRTKLSYYVNVGFDKMSGLSASLTSPVPEEEEVNGEPPKPFKAACEREFRGREYVLFPKGRCGGGASGQGQFSGNGNGSTYQGCKVVMKYKYAAGNGTRKGTPKVEGNDNMVGDVERL
ncbi:hypothetical protein CR513_60688, partial [Mucuna pruriens]